ncbi:hypothetical protein PM082_000137 [Marasmius tenuissimus]|nr:hypothetical protein PM082_000137 [Marasmius tenuissimus]
MIFAYESCVQESGTSAIWSTYSIEQTEDRHHWWHGISQVEQTQLSSSSPPFLPNTRTKCITTDICR